MIIYGYLLWLLAVGRLDILLPRAADTAVASGEHVRDGDVWLHNTFSLWDQAAQIQKDICVIVVITDMLDTYMKGIEVPNLIPPMNSLGI